MRMLLADAFPPDFGDSNSEPNSKTDRISSANPVLQISDAPREVGVDGVVMATPSSSAEEAIDELERGMTVDPILVSRRLLMTADPISGVWRYAIELTRVLGELGMQVGLAIMGAPLTRTQRAEAGLLPNTELFESPFKVEWMEDPWPDVERAGDWLLQLEDSFHPDVVHLNGLAHGALPWRAPKIVVAHGCVLSRWQAVNRRPAPPALNTYRDAATEGLHLADLVIAPTQAVLSELNQHYGPLPASRVIRHGCELPLARARHKHDFLLACGRMDDEARNIEALAGVVSKLPWPLYVAGQEHDPEAPRMLDHHVHYLGRLSLKELLPWLERAAIYTLPARYEPSGLCALEAALAGCALVLGDIPSLREIWDGAALFVSPDDSAGLEAALRDLIASPRQLTSLSAKARETAARFTAQRMAADYLSAYADVIEWQPRLSSAQITAGENHTRTAARARIRETVL